MPDAYDSLYPTPVATSDAAVSSGKTNVVRFSERVRDWINSLTPPSATTYDTGWVVLPLASGYTAAAGPTPAVRRIGSVVYFKGSVQGTFTGPANVTIVAAGGIPASCRPSAAAIVAIGNNSTSQPVTRGSVGSDGSLAVILGSVSPGNVALGPANFALF